MARSTQHSPSWRLPSRQQAHRPLSPHPRLWPAALAQALDPAAAAAALLPTPACPADQSAAKGGRCLTREPPLGDIRNGITDWFLGSTADGHEESRQACRSSQTSDLDGLQSWPRAALAAVATRHQPPARVTTATALRLWQRCHEGLGAVLCNQTAHLGKAGTAGCQGVTSQLTGLHIMHTPVTPWAAHPAHTAQHKYEAPPVLTRHTRSLQPHLVASPLQHLSVAATPRLPSSPLLQPRSPPLPPPPPLRIFSPLLPRSVELPLPVLLLQLLPPQAAGAVRNTGTQPPAAVALQPAAPCTPQQNPAGQGLKGSRSAYCSAEAWQAAARLYHNGPSS